MEVSEKVLQSTAEYSFNIFLKAMEDAAKSDKLDEYHTAVGFICDSVGYMKECGIEEEDLVGHIRSTYKAHTTEDEFAAQEAN
jgi:polyisoprenoid-binding protein YceI